jgi:hypothetical protein
MQGHCHVVSLSPICALVTLFKHIICRTELALSFCGIGSSKLGIEWHSAVLQSSAGVSVWNNDKDFAGIAMLSNVTSTVAKSRLICSSCSD